MAATSKVRHLLHSRAGATPRRWMGALAEVVLLAVVLFAFTRLHAVVVTDIAAASANALDVQSVERGLHLNIELATNQWLTGHQALIPAAVLYYRLYYIVLIGVVIWVFLRHPEVYLRVRRTFVAMTGLALLVYWAFPLSPPRFALPGAVDTVAGHDILAASTPDMSNGANFTAMPSIHVGWSAWCAYAVWSALRASHPRGALLPWLFPLIMVAVVLATASHYVLDVLGSGLLLIASIGLSAGWARLVNSRSAPPGDEAEVEMT
ncbi:MAG: phosphatase PAP2 family protein [Nakamurella sp.]